MLFAHSTYIFLKNKTCHTLVTKSTKCGLPHRIYSKVTWFTQLLRETHSKIFCLSASVGPDLEFTRLRVGDSPALPRWTSRLHTVPSSCLISTRRAMEMSILPCLPSVQFHPAKPSHDLRLHVMACQTYIFVGGLGAGGMGLRSLQKLQAPICEELLLMSD